MRQRLIIFITIVVSLLAVGGAAWANIPGANGVINACRKSSDGSLRVIDAESGQKCATGYTPLNWNQTGPAGATGPAGPAGATGPAGPAGISGYEVVTNTVAVDRSQGLGIAIASCPAGKRILGGGGGTGRVSDGLNTYYDAVINESRPMYEGVTGFVESR